MPVAPSPPLADESAFPDAAASGGGGLSVDSGKGAGDENFPVGSFLIAPALRPAIACFYRFARTADDIADSDRLSPEEKIARLDAMQATLEGAPSAADAPPWVLRARALQSVLAKRGVTRAHALDLLAAFRQDAVKSRYENWAALQGYCMLSAAPVGRFLLDLHGEARAGWPASDALCNALQVLNHLQDCAKDYAALDRVYLPLDWLEENGVAIDALRGRAAGPGLRAVLDSCLDATALWIETARQLPPQLKSRRLAMESAVILRLAETLAARLRRADPLAGRVALTRWDFARAGIAGVWAGLQPRPRRAETAAAT